MSKSLASLKTPFYHMDESLLEYDIALLQNALKDNWGNYICGYSVKTNSLPWLLTRLKKSGFYAEVVSAEEYILSLHLGYTPDQVIYNSPIKERWVFDEVLLHGGYVNMDSHDEPLWLAELCEEHPDRTFSIGVRVNCDLASMVPDEILPESDGGRFGYCYENGDLGKVIELVRSIPNAHLAGLHLHSSTQSRTVNAYGALAKTAVKLAREYNLDLSYIDMGGGYFGGRDDMPSYPDYFKEICKNLREQFDPAKTCIIAEPGVSLISRATTFVTTVLDYKDIREHRYLVTDSSRLNLNPQVTRHTYPHHIIKQEELRGIAPAARPLLPTQWVCGHTCMEYDRLFEIQNDEELLPGDRIVYDTAGGYTMCLNPLFIRYLPAVWVTKTDGSLYEAREPWGVEEYLQKNYWE